ncbi:MAG: protein phosphatase 2C domain-containing protein [Trichodesmium sp. MAG_R01]|nr:protein phosphatase 2C domain-containing protein [Trichodesmium sp. MAG_R01]
MNWKATYYCAKGTWHEKHNIPCQDYANYHCFDKVILGAVADGAGSAKYADIGAQLAVDKILKFLEQFQQKLSKKSWFNNSSFNEEEAKQLFCDGIQKKVIPALEKEAQEKKCDINEFACTLIAFIATPNCITAMQIGDGFLVLRLNNKKDYQLLLKPDKGEFINETKFVTSKNVLSTLNFKFLSETPKFICASTDGLEKVAILLSNLTPHAPFFKPLEIYLEQTKKPEFNTQYLEQFLNSERLNSRTNDDKTLLLCLNN